MSYSSISFVCASHMCPSQYTTGLADGFYLCAMMVLGISFIEHMVNHIHYRGTYTMEEEDQEPVEDVEKVQEPVEDVEKVEEPVQEVEKVEEPVQEVEKVEEPVEDVQEVLEQIQKVIQDVQEFIQEVQEQPQDDSEVSTPRHKMRRLQI
jgi:outer membrane biosynthesis protein TonB